MRLRRGLRADRVLEVAVCLVAVSGAYPAWGQIVPNGDQPRGPGSVEDLTARSPSSIEADGLDASLVDGVGVVAGGGTFSNVGADACFGVTVVPATVGPPGSPVVTTIQGDNTPATAPDCQGAPFVNRAVWWEGFELTEKAAVRIDLCGTTPEQNPSYQFLLKQAACPLSGTVCGNRTVPVQAGRGSPYCTADNNAWWRYTTLDPGIYLIPIFSETSLLVNGRGPYQAHITVEGLPGACCDLDTGTCVDNETSDNCQGVNQVFSPGDDCCFAECRLPNAPFASRGMEMLSHIDLAQFGGGATSASDCWGYTSPSGREYALIGLSNRTGVVDITDPFNPQIIGTPTHTSSFWWDGKVYDEFLYTSNENGGGLQIIDLRNVDNGFVSVVGALTTSGLSEIHTTTLNPDSGFAYLNGSNLAPGGFGGDLVVVSLANPANPTMLVTGAAARSYVHDSLVVSYSSGPYTGKEIAFCFCGGNGLKIVDVTNKANMTILSTLVYPGLSYCHQGWLTPDRRYMFMNDELDESNLGFPATTYVVDVQNLSSPFLADTYTNGKCHIDHDLITDGPWVYKASYARGLEVDDASDPLNAHEVAYFDTHPEGNSKSFVGVWGSYAGFPSGVVLASDIERGLFVLNFDCNRNGIDDTDDIGALTSTDCNGNGLPDECEHVEDCNNNSIPDLCEGLADTNSNGIPDVCDCASVAAAGVEPSGVGKNRFLSLVPGNAGASAAIRVRLTSLDLFHGFDGQVRWVGPPQPYPDLGGGTIHASLLQCTPHYQDWSAVGTLHVYGAEVVPNSTFDVQLLHQVCPGGGGAEAEFTSALTLTTNKWGDIVDGIGGPGQPNFADIASIVGSFQNGASAPKKPRALLQPNVPDPASSVNFLNVSSAVSGFQGVAYPFAGPAICP